MGNDAREVLLVGSVPLRPASAVFESVARNLGTLVPRIPDGEQVGWIRAVFQSHERNPALESKRKVPLDSGGRFPTSVFSLKPGKTPDDLVLGPYGYADNAIKSYQQFKVLRDAGTIPKGTRFQVTMPGPGTSVFVVEVPAEQILPKARQALLQEIERIIEAIPAADLTDNDYAAFAQLALPAGTKLYLGLLNLADGLDGAKKRIAMASKVIKDFGIAMFCGLGRAPGSWVGGPGDSNVQAKVQAVLRRATPETVDEVLTLHKQAASL